MDTAICYSSGSHKSSINYAIRYKKKVRTSLLFSSIPSDNIYKHHISPQTIRKQKKESKGAM